ncbi:MAG: hypothetical protein U0837_06850 [Dehalococcoidia bacterium]|jgi:hypothetical protein
MGSYLVVYHGAGGAEGTREEKMVRMENWLKWMGGLAGCIEDAGHPASRAWTVSKDGTTEDAGANPATGYSILTCASMQEALDKVVASPHLQEGGTIELIELLGAGMASVRD